MMDTFLDDTIPQVYKWDIKIRKRSSWIALGICLDRNIKNEEFVRPDLSRISHGNNLICSTGFSYSHSNDPDEVKKKQTGFTFEEGDIVSLSYDTANHILEFRNKRKIYQMKVKPSEHQQYRPCVYLKEKGE